MTGIVLIGGKSRRFGSDKVVAKLKDKHLVDHVIEVITPLFDEVILIGNPREALTSHRIVEDLLPGLGPLGGIYTALSTISTPQCFVFAADMPNLHEGLIRYMMTKANGHDIVIPVWSRGREPLHAIYHRRALPVIEELLKQNSLRIFDLLKNVDTLAIGEEEIRSFTDPETTFANINTVSDRDRLE